MELAVDTNVLISSIVKDSETRKLLVKPDLSLYSPEFMLSELLRATKAEKHKLLGKKQEIIDKAKISGDL